MSYQTRYTGFALWLTVVGFLGLMVFGLLAGVAQADETGVSYTNAGSITVVTQTSSGQYSQSSGYNPSLSADGRFIAFVSQGNDLVPGVAHPSIFVHDTQTKQFEVVSRSSAGSRADANSSNPAISADGRYVVFSSLGSNLVSGDNNNVADVFIHDRQTHQTERVSVSSAGVEGNQQSSQGVVIGQALDVSSDGRYVSYSSDATNLVEGDTNNTTDVFVRDRQTGQTERVSITSSGVQANGGSIFASMSADGRYVSFVSYATNLVSGDTNNKADVFVHDRQTHQIERVSVSSSGQQVTGEVNAPMLSGDGRYVVFESSDGSLEAGDTNGNLDVFIHDRQTHTTSRIKSVTTSVGGIAPQISDNGAYVVFFSLFPTSSDKRTGDISLYNVQTAALTENLVASITGFNPRSTYYDNVAVSNDGRYIVFAYELKPIIPSAPAHRSQVFLIDREGTQPPTPTFTPTPGTPTPITPTPVAGDSGFKMSEHAWPFDNSAKTHATWDAFRGTYGSEAIEWKILGIPFAYENAKDHYDLVYTGFGEIGMCHGMVTTAAHRYAKNISLTEGVSAEKLRDVIPPTAQNGYWLTSDLTNYLYQYTGRGRAAEQRNEWIAGFTRPLTETVRLLQQSINGKLESPYALVLYGGDKPGAECEGHVVLPIAYSQTGNTTVFTVYDPNHNNQAGQVTVNPSTKTWTFDSEPTLQWGSQYVCTNREGNPVQNPLFAMSLIPDTHLGIPTWDTSTVSAASKDVTPLRELYVNHQMATTIQGGNAIQYIPTGRIPGQKPTYPTTYFLDAGVPFSVTSQQEQNGESSITLFDPHMVLSIKGQALQGTVDTVAFAPDASAFSMRVGETVTRSITAISGDRVQQYRVDLGSINLNAGTQAHFIVGDSGKITVKPGTGQESGYQAHFLQASINGTSEFTLTMPTLEDGDTHLLQPNWTNNSVTVSTDVGSNGSIDTQETIQSEALRRVYLPLIKR